MPARTPEELHELFAEAFTTGDIEIAMTLYEPDAILVPQPGQLVTGLEAIREVLTGFLAMKPTFNLVFGKVFQAGDLALLFSDWTIAATGPDGSIIDMGGRTADVARRQPDGNWLYVIDNPFGYEG